jgi:hypothetical protein
VLKSPRIRTLAVVTALASAWGSSAMSAQDKYTVKVPGGLAFSEFRGYEGWQLISISDNGAIMAATLGNPTMIQAYKAGFPGNGKPFSRRLQDGQDPLGHEKVGGVARRQGAGHAA